MKITVILLSLFTFAMPLESPTLKIGYNISFDSSNNEFVVPYEGPDRNNFLFLISHEYKTFDYEIRTNKEFSVVENCDIRAHQFLLPSSGGNIRLKFLLDQADRGSFIIYDFKAKYKIKLKNKYGMLYGPLRTPIYDSKSAELASKLTFLVPNFRNNSNIYFKYVQNLSNYSPFPNPFEVCDEIACFENVTKFYFEKGKSYKIYVHLKKVKYISSECYAVPPFSFYAEDFNEIYSNDDIEYKYDKYDESSNNSVRLFIILALFLILF